MRQFHITSTIHTQRPEAHADAAAAIEHHLARMVKWGYRRSDLHVTGNEIHYTTRGGNRATITIDELVR